MRQVMLRQLAFPATKSASSACLIWSMSTRNSFSAQKMDVASLRISLQVSSRDLCRTIVVMSNLSGLSETRV